MSPWIVALVSFACVMCAALAGMRLRRALPEHHLNEASKDTVRLVSGLIATLSALVLGLLIASSKNSFDAVNDGLKHSAAKVIQIDRLLAQYGPEADAARAGLRAAYAERLRSLFPQGGGEANAANPIAGAAAGEQMEQRIHSLVPGTDMQRSLQRQALALSNDIALARWVAMEEIGNRTPPALLAILVLWLAAMFGSFGLFAPNNVTALVALLIGAMSVATSILLIEEMGDPLGGLISVSSAPMVKALALLGT